MVKCCRPQFPRVWEAPGTIGGLLQPLIFPDRIGAERDDPRAASRLEPHPVSRLNAGLAMRDVGRTRRGLGFVKIRRMRQSQPQQGRHPALAGQTNGRKAR
jgi:hypothetical protein